MTLIYQRQRQQHVKGRKLRRCLRGHLPQIDYGRSSCVWPASRSAIRTQAHQKRVIMQRASNELRVAAGACGHKRTVGRRLHDRAGQRHLQVHVAARSLACADQSLLVSGRPVAGCTMQEERSRTKEHELELYGGRHHARELLYHLVACAAQQCFILGIAQLVHARDDSHCSAIQQVTRNAHAWRSGMRLTKGVMPLRGGLDAPRVRRCQLAQGAHAGRMQPLAQQLADTRHLSQGFPTLFITVSTQNALLADHTRQSVSTRKVQD